MPKQRRLKAIKVIELPALDVSKALGSDAIPVEAITLSVDGNRRGLAFTITKAARSAMDDVAFRALAQTLGNLCHPYPCTLVVVPEHADLRAFAVVAA